MRYKTLFRVWMKVIGVYFVVTNSASLISTLVRMGRILEDNAGLNIGFLLQDGLPRMFTFAIGLYLFFGGKWITDLAIPSNRPYCAECGYDIGRSPGDTCQECGADICSEKPAENIEHSRSQG